MAVFHRQLLALMERLHQTARLSSLFTAMKQETLWKTFALAQTGLLEHQMTVAARKDCIAAGKETVLHKLCLLQFLMEKNALTEHSPEAALQQNLFCAMKTACSRTAALLAAAQMAIRVKPVALVLRLLQLMLLLVLTARLLIRALP